MQQRTKNGLEFGFMLSVESSDGLGRVEEHRKNINFVEGELLDIVVLV